MRKEDQQVQQTKHAYQQIFSEYAGRNTMNEVIQADLDKFLDQLSGTTVLDIGCAQGRESSYLSDHGIKITGCDITEEFINLAKHNCPQGKFVVADMRNLPFEDKKFDGLWVCASFLHIPKTDAARTLSGFSRVLKSNGLLFLSVMEGNHDTLRENKQMNWPARHFSDYQLEEITGLLNATHFNTQANKTPWGPTFLHIFAKKDNL